MPVPNAFAGAALDRADGPRSDPAWVHQRLGDRSSRLLLLSGDAVAVCDGDRPLLLPMDQAPSTGSTPLLLGLCDGEAVFAADLQEADRAALPPGVAMMSIRDAGAQLAQSDGGLVAYAAAMLNWHRHHRHCSVCGASCEPELGGRIRRCSTCATVHRPRIDPVVIMLVSDGPRLLLGRRASSPPGRYSVLAGFVEPGEALEEAVVREVCEESGVLVTDVSYQSSQPWPFPAQLMLGFTAVAVEGEPRALDGELEHVGWFARERVLGAIQGREEFSLPGPVAIARRLIDAWLQTAS